MAVQRSVASAWHLLAPAYSADNWRSKPVDVKQGLLDTVMKHQTVGTGLSFPLSDKIAGQALMLM